MRNTGLDEAQVGIKTAGRNINHLRYAEDTTFMAEIEEELNSLLMKVKLLSCVQLFATPWTVAYQAPPSVGFSRQEYWSGFPFPSSGDLPDPGIEPRSPALQADALPSEPLHTDFSGGRSGGLVFPSLSEFSRVCCGPHSQRLWHSQ